MAQNNDELMHYGVIGMKWGKRKASYYTEKSNQAVSRMNKSKTRLGKSINNHMAFSNAVKANVKKSGSEKGILKTLDNAYGYGRNASVQKARSEYYDRKASYSKTKFGKTGAKANSYNMKTAAEANKKLHDSKNISEYGKNYTDAMFNRSIKTWSGRTTTTGQNYVESMLSYGVLPLAKDLHYYATH